MEDRRTTQLSGKDGSMREDLAAIQNMITTLSRLEKRFNKPPPLSDTEWRGYRDMIQSSIEVARQHGITP